MHKFTYKFLVGLTSAALLGGSVPVMAEPLVSDEAAADPSEENGTVPTDTGDEGEEAGTPDGEAEGGSSDTEQGEQDGSDPDGGDPAETDPSETDPSEEGEDSSGSEEDPSAKEDPDAGEEEEEPGEDDGTQDEDESDPEEDEEKEDEEKEDEEKEDADKDADSEKKSSDKKSKDDKKKKKSSKKETEATEETEERPELTEEERHPVIPRRITLYSVRHFKKIKAVYIVCRADEAIVREFPDASSDATIVAKLSKGAIVRMIDDSGDGWYFIETRDVNGKIVRGYTESGSFRKIPTDKVKNLKIKEDPSKVTVVKITNVGFGAVEKTTYDELSLGEDVSGTREDLVNYALQFLGNPYAEGGASLTEGTDCAGLARAVYAEFGISLPAGLEEQYNTGKKIPVKNAQPGDLIYYINDNGATEVMICLTNNKKSEKIQVIAVTPGTERIVVKKLNRNVMCRARTFDRLNAESSLSNEEVLDLNDWNWVGESRISSYCYNCNTPANSAITASGIPATEWHTVAVDKSVIPLGSKVYIEGYGVFIAEDTGVKGKWCDLYVYHHECSIWDMARVYYQ